MLKILGLEYNITDIRHAGLKNSISNATVAPLCRSEILVRPYHEALRSHPSFAGRAPANDCTLVVTVASYKETQRCVHLEFLANAVATCSAAARMGVIAFDEMTNPENIFDHFTSFVTAAAGHEQMRDKAKPIAREWDIMKQQTLANGAAILRRFWAQEGIVFEGSRGQDCVNGIFATVAFAAQTLA